MVLCGCDRYSGRPLVEEDSPGSCLGQAEEVVECVRVGFFCVQGDGERAVQATGGVGELLDVGVLDDYRERAESLGEHVVRVLDEGGVVDGQECG